jgi:hypothetical protein
MREPKFLIIDPDTSNRRELAGIFHKLGHSVDELPGASIDGKLASFAEYDCILVDSAYRTPLEYGSATDHKPLIFLTGPGSKPLTGDGAIASYDGYIKKSVDGVDNLARHVHDNIHRMSRNRLVNESEQRRFTTQPCTRLTDSVVDSRVMIRTSQVTVQGPVEDIALAAGLGNDRYSIFIGDVTGPESIRELSLTHLKPRISMHLMECHSPARLLEELNSELLQAHQDIDFLTALTMHIDISNKCLTYATAGHLPPLYRPWGSSRWRMMKSHGIPLGIRGGETYREFSRRFTPGTKVLLLSDGFLKLNGAKGGLIAWDYVLGELDMLPVDGAPSEILDGIGELIRAGTNGNGVADEVTAMHVQL